MDFLLHSDRWKVYEPILVVLFLICFLVFYIRFTIRDRKRGPSIQRKTPTESELVNARLNWHAPAELCGPLPRRVRLSAFAIFGVALANALLLPFVYLTCLSALTAETRLREPAMSTIGVCICAAVAVLSYAGILYDRPLLQWGQPTAGVLIEVMSRPGGTIARDIHLRPVSETVPVRYQFADPQGILRKGRGMRPSDSILGQVVTIVYDPDRPERHKLYPVAEFVVRL